MKSIDYYLQEGKQQEKLEEGFLPVLATIAGIRLILCCISLIFLFIQSIKVKNASTFHKTLSEKLNKILGSGKRYKVMIVPDQSINAFNMNGKTLYFFAGLFNLLTERERIAVLIHEASHAMDHDLIKQMVKKELTAILPFSMVIYAITFMVAFPISIIFSIVAFKFIYGITDSAYSKVDEYKSDNVVVKYGYGSDLASAFQKMLSFHKLPKQKPKKNIITKIIEKAFSIFDSHPDIYDRIEKASRKKEIYIVAESKGLVSGAKTMLSFINIDLASKLKEYPKFAKAFFNALNMFNKFSKQIMINIMAIKNDITF